MIEVEVASRFTEERERLGLSQNAAAQALGVNRETLRRAEMGLSEVRSSMLAAAAKVGFDVQYIVTGVRSPNINKVLDRIGNEGNAIHGDVSGIAILGSPSNVQVIHTQNHVTRVKAETRPGAEHITVEQRATLKDLVDKVVEAEQAISRKPKTHRAVWASLNSHCSVPSYSLIARGDFDKARKYLHQWLGRLGSLASAPVKDGDNWRRRHYAYIKINTKAKEDAAALDDYLRRNFGTLSLTDLDNAQLEQAYRYVAGRRNRRKSPKGS